MTEGFAKGQEAARADTQNGRLLYQWSGSAGVYGREFVAIMAERFGMTVDNYAVCFVTEPEREFRAGYNAVSIAEVNRQFGANALAFSTLKRTGEVN